MLLSGCSQGDGDDHRRPYQGGDAATGKKLVTQYQCGACHKIPDVVGAGGLAGPDLDKFGRLSYIAGGIPNDPPRLVAWLLDPPALKPGTIMPAMGMTEQEARHMAAYLYSLR
jgi:cytochrome c1